MKGSIVTREQEERRLRKLLRARDTKRQITIRLEIETLKYFKQLAKESGIKYQNLINLYLRDCVKSGKKPSFTWT